jgi:hypothetical protein
MSPESHGYEKAATARSVVVYELNEVPWSIVDLYRQHRSGSNLASLLSTGQALTTIDEDPAALSPWRTWPTLHKSMCTEEHNSYDLGQ